jgi:V/A-type H+-transporting ATPase subunit E
LQAGETAELEYKKLVDHAEAEGLTAEKRAILNEKQSIISEVLKNALNSIQDAKPDRYFELMQRLLERYAQDKEGEIILSARSKTWITPEFEKALSKRGIKISDKVCDDDGGFILIYGDIEENCTLTALIESERDRLHDVISLFLFGQESAI